MNQAQKLTSDRVSIGKTNRTFILNQLQNSFHDLRYRSTAFHRQTLEHSNRNMIYYNICQHSTKIIHNFDSVMCWQHNRNRYWYKNQKAPQGAAVTAVSMHGFTNCWKFKSPVTLTLTLNRVKVTSAYTVRVGLPVCPTV